MTEYKWQVGDKIKFHFPESRELTKQRNGIIRACYAVCQVETTENVIRVQVHLPPNGQVSQLTAETNSTQSLVLKWKDGSKFSGEFKSAGKLIPKGTVFHKMLHEEKATVGDSTTIDVSQMSFDVGPDLADAVENWHWLSVPEVARAQITKISPRYTILGQCGENEPTLESVDNGEQGELYSSIYEDSISRR